MTMPGDILFKDYYRILEIPADADTHTIKSAFRNLAKKTHPDVSDDPSNYASFVLIREAFDILTDPAKREQYDTLWKRYHTHTTARDDEDYFDTVFRDFGDPRSGAYHDEWEFFVRDPDEYLSMFEATIKLFTSSMLAAMISGLVTAGVFTSLLVFLFLVVTLSASVLFFVSYASSSALAGVVITILFIRRLHERLQTFSVWMVPQLAGAITRPLKGIPMAKGKWMIFCSYTATIIMLGTYGWIAISWMYRFISEQALTWKSLIATGGISTVIVLVASFSTAIMFDIIHAALSMYPKIQYTRYTGKMHTGIEYSRPLLGYSTGNRIGENK